mgnify:FL=1
MFWNWLFSRGARRTDLNRLPASVRDELLSICRGQAIENAAKGRSIPDCGCLERG